MPSVRLGPKFFRKERDNLYNNWPRAFCRELLQNSVDAQANRIAVHIRPHETSGCTLEFSDDGVGMSQDVLENVFFALGETTKGGDGIGGFGRARILTCFSMESYKICTGHLVVNGAGEHYEIEEIKHPQYGCTFIIHISEKLADEMKAAMEWVLARSQLDCNVFINNQLWKNWLRRYRETRTLESGSIYVNKSKETLGHGVQVRVKGMWMFDMYSSCPYQVILEVTPEKSRSILTINRDGMVHRYQREAEQWLQELAVDKRAALREQSRKTKFIKGNGTLKFSARKKKVRAPEEVVYELTPEKKPIHPVMAAVAASEAATISERVITHEKVKVGMLPEAGKHETSQGAMKDFMSIYIEDEATNPKVRKVIDKYDPTNWIKSVKYTKGVAQEYSKGSNYCKLLIAWKVACEYALSALADYNDLSGGWMVGWLFCDDERGACHSVMGDCHVLCLNPVGKDGNMMYGTSNKEDLLRIMALAKHEAAHVCVDAHNEDFSLVHTMIDAGFDSAEVLRAIRQAIAEL